MRTAEKQTEREKGRRERGEKKLGIRPVYMHREKLITADQTVTL